MTIDLLIESNQWHAHDLHKWANGAFDVLCDARCLPRGATISLLACDDARISSLNADFRNKSVPTNVLSWPAYDIRPQSDGQPPKINFEGPFMGDIAIAYGTCMREAGEQGKNFSDHVTHLCLHAMLHLMGYDHETEIEAQVMEQFEIRLLAKLGIANPYCYTDA